MEWWQIVIAISAIIGALSELYLRIWPKCKDRKKKQKIAINQSKELLSEIIKMVEQSGHPFPTTSRVVISEEESIPSLEEQIENPSLPRSWRRRLKKVKRDVDECIGWLNESDYIIETEIAKECEKRPGLVDLWESLNPHKFNLSGTKESVRSDMLEDLKRELEDLTLKSIYEGNLDIKRVADWLLYKFPDIKASKKEIVVGQGLGLGEPEVPEIIRMEDLVRSKDFQRLIECLAELENRFPSIKRVRELNKKLLSKLKKL